MRGAELFMALPWLYLLLAVRAFLPLHMRPVQAFLLLMAIIGGVGWVRPARLVRGVALSARERPSSLAARGFGAGPLYLMRRHILPAHPPGGVDASQRADPTVHSGRSHAFVSGFGGGEPVPSWGNMLAEHAPYPALLPTPGCWRRGWQPSLSFGLLALAYLWHDRGSH